MGLACIVGNQADKEHKRDFCNATLVVVPNKTIARQWEGEAQDKNHQELMDKCKKSFIVITTYKELISQYPDRLIIQRLKDKYSSDNISFNREFDKLIGLLFRIKWYRIILDEAHAIKNVNSRTTDAACGLLGKYRWALSGTPLANGSDEMYPYLKFTECESTLTSKEFRSIYFSKGKANAEFEMLTSKIMYRRTTDDDFLGRRIIHLPEKREADLLIPLSTEEQLIVDAVSDFYKAKRALLEQGIIGQDELQASIEDLGDINEQQDKKMGQKVEIAKIPSRSMGWILGRASQVRKRQAISHVFCIERLLRHSFEQEDLEALLSGLKQVAMKRTILEQIQMNMGQDDGIVRYHIGMQLLQQRKETVFGKHFDMTRLLNLTIQESMLREITCGLCREAAPPVEPLYADLCGHVFCTKCLCKAVKKNSRDNDGGSETICPNENCTKKLEVGDDIDTLETKIEGNSKGYREPGRDSNNVLIHQEHDRNGFFICSTLLEDVPMVPSTKLTATMAVVLTWLHEAPNDKILIFTQFTGTAKILGFMLKTLEIGFVYYYGGLPLSQKSRALEAIKTQAEVKVMVSTLKSGGQSLNITEANRVIIIDPWWNKTAEQQAFGRVVRMGQEKVTHLVNIRTAEDIDNRIHTLQEKKAKDVDYTLQDDGHTPPSVSEIEFQKIFSRKKAEQEEKLRKRKATKN
ncbi:P-loop containing nucleoside triphosphate hydrolase protein [Trichoderma ceciliae]